MKYRVRDLTGSATIKTFEKRKQAEQWYRHLFEFRPDSRCVIEEVEEEQNENDKTKDI
jgi:hypothetical protein